VGFSPSGELWITDRPRKRIVIYSAKGKYLRHVDDVCHSPCMFGFRGNRVAVPELFGAVKILDLELNVMHEVGANERVRPSGGWPEQSGWGWPTLPGYPDLNGTPEAKPGAFIAPHSAALGLDDTVTRQLLPSIIEYAELGDFIDAPLKTYSSGMRARLGFAIATSVDPDILLLDEVLATGDANFRAKSKARVIEIVSAAKAVVLVTHDMNWVTEYCNRAILIERGELVMEGEPAAVVELHRVHPELVHHTAKKQ
jgi:hypothetical protein